MMAGFLSAPIVRPPRYWTFLHASILAVLFLTLNADSEDPNCEVEVRVRRNTVYNASFGEYLRADCPVKFCNTSPPQVYWFKYETSFQANNISSDSRLTINWESSSSTEGTSHLSFKNILMTDSGEYQCHTKGSVGHSIRISVYGNAEHTTVTPADINDTNLDSQHTEEIFIYLYTALGIAAFVIIVISISVASLHGCKGKSKKETQTDSEYVVIPMVEQPFARTSPGGPSVPPSRRSTQRKTSPAPQIELPSPRDNEHLHGKKNKDRDGHTVEEETNSIVYAALNHQSLEGAAARPRRPQEENSEYAAICVKAHKTLGDVS